MSPLSVGSPAPAVDLATDGPTALFFYKVTCPVCQLAAPKVETFERAYPGKIHGIGQDPSDKLAAFSDRFGMTFPSQSDAPDYPLSLAFGIRVVPTVALLSDGVVADLVESWDRERLNGLSRRLAELVDAPFAPISDPGDGLPVFRPG
jgi:thiol-disulfide isomerase/thioredoxin